MRSAQLFGVLAATAFAAIIESWSRANKLWEGDAPAEPRGRLRIQFVFRLGGSLALPGCGMPQLERRDRPVSRHPLA